MSVQGRILVSALVCLVSCGNPPPPASPAQTASPAAPASPAAAAAPAALTVPDYVRAAVDAPDRAQEDSALDSGRKPDLML
ncbi:MAG TPA: hypothetical protein VGC79_13485, partial [Polyangiaceae bacterium]